MIWEFSLNSVRLRALGWPLHLGCGLGVWVGWEIFPFFFGGGGSLGHIIYREYIQSRGSNIPVVWPVLPSSACAVTPPLPRSPPPRRPQYPVIVALYLQRIVSKTSALSITSGQSSNLLLSVLLYPGVRCNPSQLGYNFPGCLEHNQYLLSPGQRRIQSFRSWRVSRGFTLNPLEEKLLIYEECQLHWRSLEGVRGEKKEFSLMPVSFLPPFKILFLCFIFCV